MGDLENFLPLIILKMIGGMFCGMKAKRLNRNRYTWSFLGFWFTIVTLIILLFLKPKMDWDENL